MRRSSTPGRDVLQSVYFNLVRLRAGESYTARLPGIEALYVVLSGRCDIIVDGAPFHGVGQRVDIWSGQADSVYAGAGAEVRVLAATATKPSSELAVAGGTHCDDKHSDAAVPRHARRSRDGRESARRTPTARGGASAHLLGHNGRGRAGNLLVSELYGRVPMPAAGPAIRRTSTTRDTGTEESAHEELYHYRFRPESGFGAQLWYALTAANRTRS